MGIWARATVPSDMTDDTITTTLRFDAETKNTYRYEEAADDAPPKLGKVYVQKWAIDGEPPEEIEVTLAPVEVASA